MQASRNVLTMSTLTLSLSQLLVPGAHTTFSVRMFLHFAKRCQCHKEFEGRYVSFIVIYTLFTVIRIPHWTWTWPLVKYLTTSTLFCRTWPCSCDTLRFSDPSKEAVLLLICVMGHMQWNCVVRTADSLSGGIRGGTMCWCRTVGIFGNLRTRGDINRLLWGNGYVSC